jgi:hypothetical protein
MNDNFGNLKLVLDSDISTHPRCRHGPTLLFSRTMGGMQGQVKKFYSCSAYRNRKDCDFYQEAGDKVTQARLFRLSEASKNYLASNDHAASYDAVKEARLGRIKMKDKEPEDPVVEDNEVEDVDVDNEKVLKFCQDCGKVSTPHCLAHTTITLSREELDRPARVLRAKSLDKKEAQYFFSDNTRQFLIDTIVSQGFTNVLCIGCPSIFECLPANISSKSLLLDLDPRFLSFYSSNQFLWFNFFNGHFFHGEHSSTIFRDFLISCEKLLILLDPPFGAKTELISYSLDRAIEQLEMFNISAKVSTMWVFPYYMERQMKQFRTDLVMSDYRVTYSDHTQFGGGEDGAAGVRKLGSPVRLFTSIPLTLLELPSAEGYRLCEVCRVWVSKENTHCDLCGVCTSKDGRTYVHCSKCERCVKPTYTHCAKCGRCKLPTHQCGEGGEGEKIGKEVMKKAPDEKTFPGKRKSRKRNRHKRCKIPKKS